MGVIANAWYSDNEEGSTANLQDGDLFSYAGYFTYCAAKFDTGFFLGEFRIALLMASDVLNMEEATTLLQGSNNSTNGNDGTWDTLVTLRETHFPSLAVPQLFPMWSNPITINSSTSYNFYRITYNNGFPPGFHVAEIQFNSYAYIAPPEVIVGGGGEESSWYLSSVLYEICLRAGLRYGQVDASNITGKVDGFYANCDNPAYTSIEALAKIFFFDASSFDKKVNFIQRGANSIADITVDDLVDDGADINKSNRKDSIEIPRVYNLEYYDIDGGLSPDKQTSDRSLDSRSKAEVRLETVVLMYADTAAQKVVINHKVAIEEQRGYKEFSLPDSWIFLTAGDIVTFEGERLRITEVEIEEGFQNYKATYDRKSAYTSSITGVPINLPSEAPTLVVGSTVLQFIDSHILRDADDRLGYYVGIAGSTDNWSGATIEFSRDGGSSYESSISTSVSSIMGTLSATLPAHNRNYPDDRNTLTITLLNSSFELSPTTLAGMMNRANLAIVGNEIINFADAVEISGGVWELSYLLRGRKGTAAAIHAIGERFMLLDRQTLAFVDAELYELGKSLTFRATSFGASSGTEETFTFTGQSQKEKVPGYLSAVRSGGDIIITWQGCGRLGGGAYIGMGQFFSAYRVTVNGTVQTTTNETVTVIDPGGSVEISVQQVNSITGTGPAATVTI